ncbi:MAG: AhpC/TSA family protein [Dysgonamonadaceae bacterium]|jgi:peroxiredoxin|nr:AhpC/TSA family protein [Dysgonamonadaceae bacterium]
MRKTGLLSGALALCLATYAGGIEYRISGTWPGGDGKTIYLQKKIAEKTYESIDSVVVANGLFEFKGNTPEICLGRLQSDGKTKDLFLCGEPLQVEVQDKLNPKNGKPYIQWEASGSEEQKAYETSQEIEMGKAFIDLGLMMAMSKEKDDPVKLDSLVKMKNSLAEATDNRIRKYVDDNLDRVALTYFIGDFLAKNYPVEYVDSCYARLSQRVKDTSSGMQLAEKMAALKQVNVGGIAPDIALPSPDGTEIKLSALRGKYVLIDFWASWCAPCLREAPNVREVYAKYHNKGFEVFGVSLDSEKQRNAWIEAIKKFGLNWPQVSSLKGWECPVAKAYNVTGIPKTFLLDKQGRIIATDLRGDALKEKMKSLFK